jgi:hypothetical protein
MAAAGGALLLDVVDTHQTSDTSNSGRTLSTYGNFWQFRPKKVVECKSLEDICLAVADANRHRIRVAAMGAGMSWSRQLLGCDLCLVMTGLNKVGEIDFERKTIWAEGGARLGDISRALASHGLALPSLSFFPEVTIAGALATATHGTSPRWGILADFVRSITMVLPSGEIQTFGPNSSVDELCAARVAVGMLGVVTRVELQAIKMPWVRWNEMNIELSGFIANRKTIFEQYEHVWVHWTLGADMVRIECLETTPQAAQGFHPYVVDRNGCWSAPSWFSASLRPRLRQVWHALRPHRSSSDVFMNHSPGEGTNDFVRVSMQYAVMLTELESVIELIRDSDFYHANFGRVIEIKFVKGEERSFLGPNSDGDVALFNIWWNVARDSRLAVMEPFEQLMRGIGARPHWGKLHQIPDVSFMERVYPKWRRFEAVRRTFDPNGTFSFLVPK